MNEKKEQVNVEYEHSVSKDGKWYIHKTIITDIKSVNYIKKVLQPEENVSVQ